MFTETISLPSRLNTASSSGFLTQVQKAGTQVRYIGDDNLKGRESRYGQSNINKQTNKQTNKQKEGREDRRRKNGRKEARKEAREEARKEGKEAGRQDRRMK